MVTPKNIYILRIPINLSVVLLVGLHASVFAQGRYGTELTEGSLKCRSSVSGDLYGGIDNYVELDTSIYSPDSEFILSSTNGYALHDTLQYFYVFPVNPGKARVMVYEITEADTILLGYTFFEVKRVPDAQLMIDKVIIPSEGQIQKSFLMRSDSLTVYVSDDIPGSETWNHVTEFTLGYFYGGFHVAHLNSSARLMQKTREILYTLGPDREITIKVKLESTGKLETELPVYRLWLY